MIHFPYQVEKFSNPSSQLVPVGKAGRLRPLLPIRLFGPTGRFHRYRPAVADTGSVDSLFPSLAATVLRVNLQPTTSQSTNWRGSQFPLRFGRVEMELSSATEIYRWSAVVGFTSAPLPYPLLGLTGFFEYFDATFRGADHELELTPVRTFPGSIKVVP